jgi:hypothetical protein
MRSLYANNNAAIRLVVERSLTLVGLEEALTKVEISTRSI